MDMIYWAIGMVGAISIVVESAKDELHIFESFFCLVVGVGLIAIAVDLLSNENETTMKVACAVAFSVTVIKLLGAVLPDQKRSNKVHRKLQH